MERFGDIGRWIAENESLLSGLVALVILVGLVLSPIGKGIRRLYTRYNDARPSAARPELVSATESSEAAEPLVAVLAFDNLSSDPEMQFFSDGVSEEIIQRLSNGAQLKVIGRTSSFQFRGERKAEAARTLNCSHVLDGSIRRAAGRVRISAHLVEASSQTTLWSDRYDGGLEDIFTVQDEISENSIRRSTTCICAAARNPLPRTNCGVTSAGWRESPGAQQIARRPGAGSHTCEPF
jgi:TolB-like protein